MQKNLTQKNGALNNLLHINLLEIKSILYTKLLLAVNQDIEVNIDIPDKIDCIHVEPVDLTRIPGIYLDNAIETCLLSDDLQNTWHYPKQDHQINKWYDGCMIKTCDHHGCCAYCKTKNHIN